MQRDSRNLSTLGSSTYFDSREEKRPETRTRRSVRIAKKDRVQPCFRKDLERRKGSRMCLERADGCKRVNVQLKPLAWCSFSNNKALPSFSLSLVIFLAFSLPRLLSFSLSLFLSLPLYLSLSLFFSTSDFQEFLSCRWHNERARRSTLPGTCVRGRDDIWTLEAVKSQGPLAACSFVPSTRTRDRHLAFNGDDRSFPLSPNGCVYLISNTVEGPRVS